MKEKINRRWALKLLSFLCAFLVWLGVVNLADPVMTGTVEVPVEIENEEVLTANGLTYQIVGKKTATVTYKVKTTNAFNQIGRFPCLCGYDGSLVSDRLRADQGGGFKQFGISD